MHKRFDILIFLKAKNENSLNIENDRNIKKNPVNDIYYSFKHSHKHIKNRRKCFPFHKCFHLSYSLKFN